MSFYPQIGSGAVAQFPLNRTRKWRVISNTLESGERVLLPDSTAGQIEWQLSYQDLTDTEAQGIQSLFASSQGAYGSFAFVDPLANLLGWSESFSESGWQTGLLQVQSGAADPLGTQRASSVTNPAPGAQSISQTVGVPGNYVTCFSAWVRSDAAGAIVLQRDSAQITVGVGSLWSRVFISGSGAAGATQSTFSLTIPAGQTVQVWGLQVESQPAPSTYKVTSAATGIYSETYFGSDRLTITSVGPGRSTCQIQLISRV